MTADDTVTIQLSLMANLKRFAPRENLVTMSAEASVDDLIAHLGVPPDLVQMVFVDGRFAERRLKLAGVRKVLLLPTIGGG